MLKRLQAAYYVEGRHISERAELIGIAVELGLDAGAFAKAYDAPWLYGFAAMTNVARIQKREHWLSDTVAASFIGYALGSLTWSWRKKDSGAPDAVSVSPNGVSAQWSFK